MAKASTLRGTFATRPATAPEGTWYFTTDGLMSYDYTSGAWVNVGPIQACGVPPSTGWSALNTASETFSTTGGYIAMATTATATAGVQARVRTQPSTPYTVTVGVLSTFPEVANNFVTPIGFRQSSTQELFNIIFYQGAIRGYKYTSDGTVFSSEPFTVTLPEYPKWVQVSNDGTNLTFRYSVDGINFVDMYTETLATFITPDQLLVGVRANSTALFPSQMSIFSWSVT